MLRQCEFVTAFNWLMHDLSIVTALFGINSCFIGRLSLKTHYNNARYVRLEETYSKPSLIRIIALNRIRKLRYESNDMYLICGPFLKEIHALALRSILLNKF